MNKWIFFIGLFEKYEREMSQWKMLGVPKANYIVLNCAKAFMIIVTRYGVWKLRPSIVCFMLCHVKSIFIRWYGI